MVRTSQFILKWKIMDHGNVCPLMVISQGILNPSSENMQHLLDLFGTGCLRGIIIYRDLLWPEKQA